MQKKTAHNESRSSIIQTVQTPLGFFVLVVLFVEAAAGAFALAASSADRTYIVLTMLGLVLLLIIIVSLLAYHRPEALAGLRPTTTQGSASTSAVAMPDARSHTVSITAPIKDTFVTTVNVEGTIDKELPEGYTLWVFRIYPNDDFVPLRKAKIDIRTRIWRALSCDIGGKSGDKREFAAYIVGPSGAAFIEYYFAASRAHKQVRDQLVRLTPNEDIPWPPVIRNGTTDMVDCARVSVQRG
jgi:hypothetical protein